MKRKIKFALLFVLLNSLMSGVTYKINKKFKYSKKLKLIAVNSICTLTIIFINYRLKNKFKKNILV